MDLPANSDSQSWSWGGSGGQFYSFQITPSQDVSLSFSQGSQLPPSPSSCGPGSITASTPSAAVTAPRVNTPQYPSFFKDEYPSDDPLDITPRAARPQPSAHKGERPGHDNGKKRAIEHDVHDAGGAPKKTRALGSAGSASQCKGGSAREASARSKYNGRQPGSSNYTDEDLRALFNYVRALLPLGQNGWQAVAERYNAWAAKNGRKKRDWKPLKVKFENLVRTPKPTGNAEIPWYVEEALQINSEINAKANVQELDDSDIDYNDTADSEKSGSNSEGMAGENEHGDASNPPLKGEGNQAESLLKVEACRRAKRTEDAEREMRMARVGCPVTSEVFYESSRRFGRLR